MTEPKRSLVAGISSLAEAGALFAGDVAGLEVIIQDPEKLRRETRAEVVWDDAEERRYRDWVREKVQQNQEADFEELREEETFRNKLRDETEKRKTVEVREMICGCLASTGVLTCRCGGRTSKRGSGGRSTRGGGWGGPWSGTPRGRERPRRPPDTTPGSGGRRS